MSPLRVRGIVWKVRRFWVLYQEFGCKGLQLKVYGRASVFQVSESVRGILDLELVYKADGRDFNFGEQGHADTKPKFLASNPKLLGFTWTPLRFYSKKS